MARKSGAFMPERVLAAIRPSHPIHRTNQPVPSGA